MFREKIAREGSGQVKDLRKWAATGALWGVFLLSALFWMGNKTAGAGTVREGAAGAQASGQAGEEIKEALRKLQKAESMETTLTLDMETEIFRLKMNARAVMDMVTFREPFKIRSDTELDLGWLGNSAFQAYAREADGTYQLFLKEGKRWQRREVEAEELKRYDGRQMMETYLEQLEDLERKGVEELSDGSAIRYEGVLRSKGLKTVLLDTGSMEMLLTVLEQDLLKPVGELMRKNEEMLPELMSRAEDLPVILWVDEGSGYPVQCSMEITDMVNAALDEFRKASRENSSGNLFRKAAGRIWSHFDVTGTRITVQCGGFNRAEEFDIPEEALEGGGF